MNQFNKNFQLFFKQAIIKNSQAFLINFF